MITDAHKDSLKTLCFQHRSNSGGGNKVLHTPSQYFKVATLQYPSNSLTLLGSSSYVVKSYSITKYQ